MTSLSEHNHVAVHARPRRWALAWLGSMLVLIIIGSMGPETTIVRQGYGFVSAMLWAGFSGISVISLIVLARTNPLPNKMSDGKRIMTLIFSIPLMVVLCMLPALKAVPKLSVWISSDALQVDADLFGAYVDQPSRRTQRNPIKRWVWAFSHPNGETIELGLNSVFDPWYDRQYVSYIGPMGLQPRPSKRASMGNPKPILLLGVGNSFAMRVDEVWLNQ